MSKITAKRKTRSVIFYICLFVALALVWMNRGPILHGIIIMLDTVAGAIDSG